LELVSKLFSDWNCHKTATNSENATDYGNPFSPAARWYTFTPPFTLIDRKSVVFQSQSVKTLVDLDSRWQKLNQQYNHLIKTRGDRRQLCKLKVKMVELNRAHKAMLYISKIWKAVKTESAKTNPNKEKINRLKKEMTKRAKLFMKKHEKVAKQT